MKALAIIALQIALALLSLMLVCKAFAQTTEPGYVFCNGVLIPVPGGEAAIVNCQVKEICEELTRLEKLETSYRALLYAYCQKAFRTIENRAKCLESVF